MASRSKGTSSKVHKYLSQCSCHGEQEGKSGRCFLPPITGMHARENLACTVKCTWLLSAHCYTRETANKPDPLTGDMTRVVVAHIYMVQTWDDGWKGAQQWENCYVSFGEVCSCAEEWQKSHPMTKVASRQSSDVWREEGNTEVRGCIWLCLKAL